jgi:hypothetical protein
MTFTQLSYTPITHSQWTRNGRHLPWRALAMRRYLGRHAPGVTGWAPDGQSWLLSASPRL